MGAITTFKNQPVMIDLQTDFSDNGWVFSGGKAIHSACNSGLISKRDIATVAGVSYTIEFTVADYSSGLVYASIGGVQGASISSNGTVKQTIVAANTGGISFFSDGNLTLSAVSISTGSNEGITFAFNENADKWVTYYSYQPEMMAKFINSFFCFKNGELWEHNVNPLRNNFFGVQYTSKVRFVSNKDHKKEKLWYNLRLDSKGDWKAPTLITAANDLFPKGMTSRLKKANFKSIDGKLWADILRDQKDPAFTVELDALFKGRKMQGAYLVIELECADTTEAKLTSVEVYYTEIERSI